MFKTIIEFFRILYQFFNSLPEDTKEKIIKMIVDTFEKIFREFYRHCKAGGY